MKNLILKLTIAIGSIAMLATCTKNEVSSIDGLSDLTKEVITKPTLQEMKQGQFMLSVDERENLWNTKLDMILENKQERFTAHQKTIILELRDFLRIHGMSKLIKNPELGLAFLDEKLPYYAKHFNKEQLNILIESPYLNKNMLISTFDQNSIAIIAPPMEGGYCTCIYDLGCPGPGNDCENEGCTVNSDYEMCGLFGTSNCKRRCTGVEPHL